MSALPLPHRATLVPRHANAVAMLRDATACASTRGALVCEGVRLTYAEYAARVGALAQMLSAHAVRGERIGVVMPNGIDVNIACFAVLAAGAELCLVNPGYSEREMRQQLEDAAPKLVLTSTVVGDLPLAIAGTIGAHWIRIDERTTREALAHQSTDFPDIVIAADDPAVLLYTGGTTGVSKGVARTHRDVMLTIEGMEVCWPSRPDVEIWLNVAPVFHIWGFLMGCVVPVYGRAELVIVPRYKPEIVVELFTRHRVTVFGGGPAPIYSGLLMANNIADADLSALRVCPCGGSPCPPDLLQGWRDVLGVPLLQAYGMTEVAPITANPVAGQEKLGSVGRPMPTLNVEVVDLEDPARVLPVGEVGEIRVAGPTVMRGYRNKPEETARALVAGWFYTGDIGRFDADGYLYLVDRKKDMLIVGGFNVYPREIDEVLTSHPAVLDAATIGVPDARKGEVPVSFVVLKPGLGPTIDALVAHCRDHLVTYKQPREIVVRAALPKTAANKLDRKALAREVGGHG
jgi:long-chain acyl-CoA synthetase